MTQDKDVDLINQFHFEIEQKRMIDTLWEQFWGDLEKIREKFGQLKTKPNQEIVDELSKVYEQYKDVLPLKNLDNLVKQYTYKYMVR